jgi:hypothetical protein
MEPLSFGYKQEKPAVSIGSITRSGTNLLARHAEILTGKLRDTVK